MSRFVALIGHPVGHSISPAFQGAAFEHAGLDIEYRAWDVPEERLESRLRDLREPDCLGANVTIPHKESVLPFLDELGDLSARIGAVNTIVHRDGRLFGFNTDGPGFVEALRREGPFDPAGKQVLLLGAGGAARGIVLSLLQADVRDLAIVNRTHERAVELAHDAGEPARATRMPGSLQDFDLVVNTTSVGMEGTGTEGQSPCEFVDPRAGAFAVDIVYAPEETPFLSKAKEAGLRTMGGLPMLIYQGGLGFTHWTGAPAPIEVMFEAARAAMARRDREDDARR